jgi:hypothetical protein
METSEILKRIENRTGGTVQVLIGCDDTEISSQIRQLGLFEYNFKDSLTQFNSLEQWQALLLLSATFHKTLAYQVQIMSLHAARELASDFIGILGGQTEYFSNCFCDDDVNGIGSWSPVTKHTFESILYCRAPDLNALVVCVDED